MTGTATSARDWILAFAGTIDATEDELTRLDQSAGDGDFGENMAGAVRTVRTELEALPQDASDAAVLHVTASVFLDHVGGTSGPLFGLLFQELAAAVDDAGALSPAALATGAAAGLAAIQRVGEAEVGDKTLVDALAPAVDALRAADGSVTDALRAAGEAAATGARDTTQARARRGRASYVGEHARGVPDPGAVTVGYLFGAAT